MNLTVLVIRGGTALTDIFSNEYAYFPYMVQC
jgi:hypothetical protein